LCCEEALMTNDILKLHWPFRSTRLLLQGNEPAQKKETPDAGEDARGQAKVLGDLPRQPCQHRSKALAGYPYTV
jgi:hypothetical protein